MATSKKIERRIRVKRGVRRKIFGTSDRPRFTVFRSNRHVYGQLVDDASGHTLASASSLESDVSGDTPVKVSQAVGARLAERAKEAGIKTAVFDRNGYRYHGRVKALAEGAREGGLSF
jgi:large subunit ribosomal protein L18